MRGEREGARHKMNFNGMYLFREELEFEMFKVLLSELKVEYGFKIHHYCLMNTHFHLLVSISNVHGFSFSGLNFGLVADMPRTYPGKEKIRENLYHPCHP